jgi:hypothetical protein
MIGATGTISKSFRLPEQHIGKARNKKTNKKHQFWALYTYFRKYEITNIEHVARAK